MIGFKINKEYVPERCDICHNNDCFNAQNNYCSRCYKINLKDQNKYVLDNKKTINPFARLFKVIGMYILTIITMLVINLFVGIFCLRLSVLLIMLPSIITLLTIWHLNPLLYKVVWNKVIILHLCLILIPCDIRIFHVGKFRIQLRPIAYGLLTKKGVDAVKRGEYVAGGCVVTEYPAIYAVVITY